MIHLLLQHFGFPGRHRSGFFGILMLLVLTVSGPRSWEVLGEAKQWYFDLHPDFASQDHNERRVNNLIATHLTGQNAQELQLIEEIEQDPLHQQVMEQLVASSRVSPASRSRSRSRGRVELPLPKAKPRAKVQTKARPPAKSKAALQPGQESESSTSSGSGDSSSSTSGGPPGSRSEVSDDNDDTDYQELSREDWVQRDCWVCRACGSVNLRFTQWCTCNVQRESLQTHVTGDWNCDHCGNLNFSWRTWCAWSDCPTNDWTCTCGNLNFARRKFCNRRICQKRRPW